MGRGPGQTPVSSHSHVCIYIYIYFSIYIYIFIHVCMYCMYVCIYVCMYVCMHACVYVYVCICVYIYLHVYATPTCPDLIPWGLRYHRPLFEKRGLKGLRYQWSTASAVVREELGFSFRLRCAKALTEIYSQRKLVHRKAVPVEPRNAPRRPPSLAAAASSCRRVLEKRVRS